MLEQSGGYGQHQKKEGLETPHQFTKPRSVPWNRPISRALGTMMKRHTLSKKVSYLHNDAIQIYPKIYRYSICGKTGNISSLDPSTNKLFSTKHGFRGE